MALHSAQEAKALAVLRRMPERRRFVGFEFHLSLFSVMVITLLSFCCMRFKYDNILIAVLSSSCFASNTRSRNKKHSSHSYRRSPDSAFRPPQGALYCEICEFVCLKMDEDVLSTIGQLVMIVKARFGNLLECVERGIQGLGANV